MDVMTDGQSLNSLHPPLGSGGVISKIFSFSIIRFRRRGEMLVKSLPYSKTLDLPCLKELVDVKWKSIMGLETNDCFHIWGVLESHNHTTPTSDDSE